MEKFGKFRDRGTGIAPFQQISPQFSWIWLPLRIVLFTVRASLLTLLTLLFLITSFLPTSCLAVKLASWTTLFIMGIFWLDLRVDGVGQGTLAQNRSHLPHAGSIVVSALKSPIDCVYLAAIFDPVFTQSFTSTNRVRLISLRRAVLNTLTWPKPEPTDYEELHTLASITKMYPNRIILVFPEATPTNGRALLSLTPSLTSVSPTTQIFPLAIHYNSTYLTTPVPGWRVALTFIWLACSIPSHFIKVRIGRPILPNNLLSPASTTPTGLTRTNAASSTPMSSSPDKRLLDHVANVLSHLGKVKRVALSIHDKVDFLIAYFGMPPSARKT